MFPLQPILDADLCSSCGVCTGICPVGCLEMKDTPTGEYRPELINDACTQCGLCEKVCPFGSGPNEDRIATELYAGIYGIQKTSRGGYVLESVCGGLSDQELRLQRTSGGLGVWLLAKLIESGTVDRVVSVRSCPDSDRLFEFAEFSTPEDVFSSTRSCYYPVELSECLKKIRESSLRYAVVGVPCMMKAVQKARLLNKKLAENIAVTVGLVCSCQKTKHFAEYLIRKSDIDPRQAVGFSFRVKDGKTDADNCLMVRINMADGTEKTVLHEEYAKMWSGGLFSMKACGFCDDHFAETADVALMDAKHLVDPQGTTVALVRTPLLRELLQQGIKSRELLVERISLQQALDCQNGCDHWKRAGTACMLAYYASKLPEGFMKRVAPSKKHFLYFVLKERRRIACRTAFDIQRKAGPGTDLFWKTFRRLTRLERGIDVVKSMKRAVWKRIGKA